MEIQSWTESWKMKQQIHPPPTSSKSWMKLYHFPILVCRGGGINFPCIMYKHRRQSGGILNINYSRLRVKFLPQAAQYHGQLWRQNYDDQIVNVRPGSVTYWPDFKIKTVNWSLRQEEWQKKRKKENKNKTAFEPRGINQRDELRKWHLSF